MKSPCIGCALEFKDKNGAECLRCSSRINYVAALGPMSMGVNVELSDLRMEDGMARGNRISPAAQEFIREHRNSMKAPEIARKLGISAQTVDNYKAKFKADEIIKNGIEAPTGPPPAPFMAPPPEGKIELVLVMSVEITKKFKRLAAAHFRTLEAEFSWMVVEADNKHARLFSKP